MAITAQLASYFVAASKSSLPTVILLTKSCEPVFSTLRVYAITRLNRVVASVVFLLSVVPVFANIVSQIVEMGRIKDLMISISKYNVSQVTTYPEKIPVVGDICIRSSPFSAGFNFR